MNTSDFNYDLPEELIAQTPIEPRDHSRLMVLDKQTGAVRHKHFYDIVDHLNEGDLLILNDSRVLPARIYGKKPGGTADIEFLLLENRGNDVWEVLVRPGKKVRIGAQVVFGEGLLTAQVLDIIEGGNRLVKFRYDGFFYNLLDQIGQMPLPPYITEKLQDKERYQTVYSKEIGSAAAPTAGLHFTDELLERIRAKGIRTGFVTLHVGLGTFRPVKVEDVTKHQMHSEHYFMPKETADMINETKEKGGRVICVGTTSCRTVEAVWQKEGCVKESAGSTDIFIYPGYRFGVLDALITNFHLPESTLIMLISALAGRDHVLKAYEEAVREKYRFFSFGDAMFIE
ncbi:tRNA preQ1(34) S-adenosylmethionine ribosyltransferase-isomerase QueA [Candidatus Soleaferrea massiliensis]|uniref:tRNA preQ1(34) S-adenosylmethionine ribosyltransferase-isomerase QueA n=1 Tax=Candidatus Soleaferrea massiliensis TaxID=1470354 RepID=UPI00058CCC5D|nr:tRNA preQ1(34) S-adenosylmethionine ribosyltransferase-isomerase QueA [Candidatus Soleaferrea massiliensis]